MAPPAWTAMGRKTGFSIRESMEALEKLIAYTGNHVLIQEADVEDIMERKLRGDERDLLKAVGNENSIEFHDRFRVFCLFVGSCLNPCIKGGEFALHQFFQHRRRPGC